MLFLFIIAIFVAYHYIEGIFRKRLDRVNHLSNKWISTYKLTDDIISAKYAVHCLAGWIARDAWQGLVGELLHQRYDNERVIASIISWEADVIGKVDSFQAALVQLSETNKKVLPLMAESCRLSKRLMWHWLFPTTSECEAWDALISGFEGILKEKDEQNNLLHSNVKDLLATVQQQTEADISGYLGLIGS